MSYEHPKRVDAVKEIPAILERREKAANEVARLCQHPGKWRMSIPVEGDDSDILLSESLMDISHLAEALGRINDLMFMVSSVITSAWGDSEDGFEPDEPQAQLFALLNQWQPENK